MELSVQLFSMLLVSGLLLVAIEIFVPGGVLGAIGGILLLGAVITGFFAFPGLGGFVALGIIVLTGIVIAAWIKFFPRTWVGKQMTMTKEMSAYKATQEGLDSLVGKLGEAKSDLRPGGFALIESKRVDVVTQGEMISKGEPIRVVRVEGNRIVVRRADRQPDGVESGQD